MYKINLNCFSKSIAGRMWDGMKIASGRCGESVVIQSIGDLVDFLEDNGVIEEQGGNLSG